MILIAKFNESVQAELEAAMPGLLNNALIATANGLADEGKLLQVVVRVALGLTHRMPSEASTYLASQVVIALGGDGSAIEHLAELEEAERASLWRAFDKANLVTRRQAQANTQQLAVLLNSFPKIVSRAAAMSVQP